MKNSYVQTDSIQIHFLVFDIWVLLSNVAACLEEQAVRQTPDRGKVIVELFNSFITKTYMMFAL